jgi:fructoselysine/glucoselysine PTS system EIIB component
MDKDCILIANDEVAKDSLRSSVLRMAAPSGVKLVIKSLEDSITALNSGVTDKYHLMIILESIKDANELTKHVPSINKVNLGGVKTEEGKKQISMAVFVSPEEVIQLKDMNQRGIAVEVKMIPEDKGQDVMDLIK